MGPNTDQMPSVLQLMFKLEGQPPHFEIVLHPSDAARLVVKRERFELRKLDDSEYELFSVIEMAGCKKIEVWTDSNYFDCSAYVELERRLQA